MPDYFGTYQNVNVLEYLDFFARAYGLAGQERLRAIDEVMEFTALDTLAYKPIDGLSKGMKQRLCLGRTMIHNPSVLILDEPAAGLDPRARIELREMIERLAAAGKAILDQLAHSHGAGGNRATGWRSSSKGKCWRWVRSKRSATACKSRSTVRSSCAARWRTTAKLACGAGRYFRSEDRGRPGDIQPCGRCGVGSGMLRAMVEAGFPVIEFGAQHKRLEDVFLHVTEGRVQ